MPRVERRIDPSFDRINESSSNVELINLQLQDNSNIMLQLQEQLWQIYFRRTTVCLE